MNTGNSPQFYTIGEVTERTGVKSTVLRFWESEFPQLCPHKNKFGHRMYTDDDISLIEKIKFLLYEEGFTIKGAILHLNGDETVRQAVAHPARIRRDLEEILEILHTRKSNK